MDATMHVQWIHVECCCIATKYMYMYVEKCLYIFVCLTNLIVCLHYQVIRVHYHLILRINLDWSS